MNNVNRGGPSSTMLIIIGLITICLLSAYATATWPFAMREGYRRDPNWRGAPGRVSTGVIRGPYKPGGGKPGTGGWVSTQPYKPGGGKPGTRPYKPGSGGRPKRPRGPYKRGGGKRVYRTQ